MVKNCAVCGTDFTPQKNHAEYCGRSCRDKAYRERKATESPRAPLGATTGGSVPDDDREALREVYRAAIAVILADGLVMEGRRGESSVAHPLLRFVGQWFSALDKGEVAPTGSADDLDDAIARILVSTDDMGNARETKHI